MSREWFGGSSRVDARDLLCQRRMPRGCERRGRVPAAVRNFGVTVLLAAVIPIGIAAWGTTPASAAIIDNGTVQLGINDAGHLIVSGVGLRYIPSGGESLAPGCDCEGWGVANAHAETTTFAGYAQVHDGPSETAVGVVGLVVQPETGVTVASGHTQPNSAGSAFKSVVTTLNGRLKVTHDYRPSSSANLYEIVVTIQNIGATSIGDLRYRRFMDWDIPPFAFDEWVKIHIGSIANFLGATTDGFQLGNPLSSAGPDLGVGSPPTTLTGIGDYSGGSSDQGALFDFAFGSLAPGQIKTFRLYYGAATTEAAALAAIGAVGAPVYSLGIPRNAADTGPDTGGPHVFIFAAKTVNDNPTISDIADQFTNEDTASGPHPFTLGDAETPAASLTVSGSSSNTALVPNANIVFGGAGASRTVTVTPAPNQFGTATITVTVSDGAGGSASDTFLLTVNSVNDNPTISDIADQFTNEDTASGPHAFIVGDVETLEASLMVSGSSSNTALVPNANIVFGGAGANRTVTVTPAPNQFGTATITVTVSDGAGGSASDTFLLTVNAVNDAPVATNDLYAIAEDTTLFAQPSATCPPVCGPDTLGPPVLVNDSDLDGDTLTALLFAGPTNAQTFTFNPDGSFTYKPNANFNGTDSFTYQARDPAGALSNVATVTITVNAVNDAPVANNDTATVGEDSGPNTIPVLNNDAPGPATATDESSQTRTVTAVTQGTKGAVAISAGGGSVIYTPTPNANGTDSFAYTVCDNGTPVECASATVNVTITPDNPTVTSVSLARILQFQTLDVTITGTGFDPGATADFGPATQVQSVIFKSKTELVARVFAVPAGPIGASSNNKVKVTNPDGGVFETAVAIFTVIRDTDGDGVADNFDFGGTTGLVKDNCPNAFNPSQIDSDNDGIGNDCDASPQGTFTTTPTGTTDQSTTTPAPGAPVFHQVCVTFLGQGTPYFFAPPDDRTVDLQATAGGQTLDERIFESVIMDFDGLEFNDGTSNIERCIVIDLSQRFALPPGTAVDIHTEYNNRAQPQAADQLSAPLLIAEVDLGTKTLMVQSGSPAQTVGGDLTVNPQFWNILWETHPTTATAVFSLSSLTDGATLEQIDLSSLLFEGSLAPASAQLKGGILNLQVNKTDLLRALRKRIVHPFTIDEVERVQLTGRLTDGSILRTGVDITLQNSVEHIDALIAKIQASTISAALKNSTIAKLQDARTAILNGQTTRACGKLKDFIREVTGQRGKGIPTAQADEWIADATHIQNIECV